LLQSLLDHKIGEIWDFSIIASSWLGKVVMVVQRILKGTSKIPSSIDVVQREALLQLA
jgi:hypothetical protein